MNSNLPNFTGTQELDALKVVIRLRQLLEPLEFPLKEIALLLPIINNLPTTIYIKDSKGVHVLVNNKDLQIKGVKSLDEVIGKTDFDFFSAEQAQQFRDDELRVIETQIPLVNKEEYFVDKEGNERWLLTTKIPLYDHDGNVIGIIGIGNEFTKHRQELGLLIETTLNVVRALDLHEALQQIASGAMRLLDAVSAVIYLVEKAENGNYRIVDTFSHPPQLVHPPPRIQDKPEGITYHVITTGESVAIENTSIDARVQRELRNERAMIAVPLKFRDHISGVLYVNDSKPRPFSVNDRERLSRLAEYAVIAIENSQLLTELRFSRYQLQTLLEASQSLGALSRPDDVLRKMIENALKASEADWGTVVLYEGDHIKQLMEYPASNNFDKDDIRSNGNSIKIFQSGKTLYFKDIDKYSNNINPMTLKQGFKSVIGLPLTSKHGPIGVLWLHYYQPHRLSRSYIEALEAYARQGATIYSNTVRALTLTQMIAKVMQLGGSKRIALLSIAKMMQELVKCDAVTLYVYNAEHEEIEYPPTLLGIWDEAPVLYNSHIDPKSIIYTMMHKTERYVAENVQSDGYFKEARFVQAEDVKSCVVIPLHANDKKVGVMFVNYRSPRHFSDDDLNYMQIFANYAAEAINNTQLLNQSQERAAAFDLLRDIQSKISSAQDIDTILSKIAVGAMELSKIETNQGTGVIFLIDWENNTPKISEPFPQHNHIPRPQLDSDKSITRHIIETWKTVVIPNVDQATEAGEITDTWATYGAKSMVVTPLIIREQVIGVLYVIDQQNPRKFTEAEIGYLKTLAGEAAIAIQNTRLFQQQIKAFDEIAESIPVSKTVEQVLEHVLHWAFSLIGPLQSANIRLREVDELVVAAHLPKNAKSNDEYKRIKMGQGVTGWVAENKQTQYVPDVSQEPLYKEYISGANSQVAVPLLRRKECIGVLNLEHSELNAFSSNDIQLAEAIAKLAVVAYENVSQFGRIQNDKNKRLKTINAMAASFNASAKSVKQVLNGLFEWIVILSQNEITNEDTITLIEIRFLDQKTDELVLIQHRGGNGRVQKRMPLSKGIVGQVAQKRKSWYVPDVSKQPLYERLVSETKSELAVPIMKGNQLIGAINIESCELDAFDDDDIQMFEAMARLVIAAFAHVRHYQQLKKIRRQLIARTALAWMGMATNTWYHEIRKFANTIVDLTKLTQQDIDEGSPSDRVIERVNKIQKAAQKIVQKHKAYPLDADSDVQSLSINRILDAQLRSYLKSDLDVNILFNPLPDLESTYVRASAWGLREVFKIVIDNAVKAMGELESESKKIVITTSRRGNDIEIEFADTGPGIPSKVLKELRRNRPISKLSNESGLGLGLLLSRVIVETYGGRLIVKSTGSTGTTILIRFTIEN